MIAWSGLLDLPNCVSMLAECGAMHILTVVAAAVLVIAALPLLLRIDSALRSGQHGRAMVEACRLALAAAAIAVLVTLAVRAR